MEDTPKPPRTTKLQRFLVLLLLLNLFICLYGHFERKKFMSDMAATDHLLKAIEQTNQETTDRQKEIQRDQQQLRQACGGK